MTKRAHGAQLDYDKQRYSEAVMSIITYAESGDGGGDRPTEQETIRPMNFHRQASSRPIIYDIDIVASLLHYRRNN